MSPAPRILLVEDEAGIRRFVRLALEGEGLRVLEATDLRGGIRLTAAQPDLVVLDLGLPDGDGMALIRDLRTWSETPVIVLSARDAEAQKIVALDSGADDYLVKPFGTGELLARVRAQLRRHARDVEEPVVSFGDIRLDRSRRVVERNGAPVPLTPLEYRLLAFMSARADRVLTHRQLLTGVWGPAHDEDIAYLRVFVAGLRRKLESDPAQPRHLLTEIGVGYRFVA